MERFGDSERRPALIYFGNDWFAENRTSSHHVARCLVAQYDVYYIECPGLRAPKATGRDLRKIVQKIRRFISGATPTHDHLWVRTLLQLPLHRFAAVRSLNFVVTWLTLRWLIWRQGIHKPIIWFTIPHLASLVGHLGESLSIYYCIDDYAALPDVDATAVRLMDRELTRKVDMVFVASDTLVAEKQELNPRAYLSPHGVDVEHFAAAGEADREIPADVRDIPQPVIGFFGLIEGWIDLELVGFLAEQRPDWTFLMIGRVAVPPESVPALPNVRFIGTRDYRDLPAYGRIFSCAIIPYRLTTQVLHANPLKLREYLAMGKPVVSVSTPETEKFADIIGIAHSREEFLQQLEQVVANPGSPDQALRRMQRVAACSWEARVGEVLSRVNSALEERHERAAGRVACKAGD